MEVDHFVKMSIFNFEISIVIARIERAKDEAISYLF